VSLPFGAPEPFTLAVPDERLRDLEARLARVRWPDAIAGSGWTYGIDVEFLRGLVEYWRTGFDWRAEERRLNGFHHFRARVGGTSVHFLHERGRGPRPLPLILTHGWPGSFVEMLKIIPLLADPASHGGDPEDAFDVVVPSLPGFGFSERPTAAGMDLFRIAELWDALMAGLGYERYGAQGGDFGAGVSTTLGLRDTGRLAGIHLNYIPGSYRPPSVEGLTEEERRFERDAADWYAAAGGYAHVQRTTPQTLAFALNDSPVGLAAWIVEKFWLWMDPASRGERVTRDDLLANVMVYWLTETISSSMRLYHEVARNPLHFAPGQRVRVPCAVARFPEEAPFPPRPWVERGYDVVHWSDLPRGGHFAALEEPELLAQDVRDFFRDLRPL
jgi:pimeloyl-ACP methyl ester carboxylesterase